MVTELVTQNGKRLSCKLRRLAPLACVSADQDAVLFRCSTQSGKRDADVLNYIGEGALLDDVFFVPPVQVVRTNSVVVTNWDAILRARRPTASRPTPTSAAMAVSVKPSRLYMRRMSAFVRRVSAGSLRIGLLVVGNEAIPCRTKDAQQALSSSPPPPHLSRPRV